MIIKQFLLYKLFVDIIVDFRKNYSFDNESRDGTASGTLKLHWKTTYNPTADCTSFTSYPITQRMSTRLCHSQAYPSYCYDRNTLARRPRLPQMSNVASKATAKVSSLTPGHFTTI